MFVPPWRCLSKSRFQPLMMIGRDKRKSPAEHDGEHVSGIVGNDRRVGSVETGRGGEGGRRGMEEIVDRITSFRAALVRNESRKVSRDYYIQTIIRDRC